MMSKNRVESNRQNATRGRGPLSAAGKARSSKNATRHGLAIPICGDAFAAADIERLSQALSDTGSGTDQREVARIAAQAHFELCRVRRRMAALLADAMVYINTKNAANGIGERSIREADCSNNAVDGFSDLKEIRVLLSQIEKLTRYERRALSKRKKALRAVYGKIDGASVNQLDQATNHSRW